METLIDERFWNKTVIKKSILLDKAIDILVCPDYRPLDFSNFLNLFYRRIDKIENYNLFSIWWKKRKSYQFWDKPSEVKSLILILCACLKKYPPVDLMTSLQISDGMLHIILPNKAGLAHHHSEAIIQDIISIIDTIKIPGQQ